MGTIGSTNVGSTGLSAGREVVGAAASNAAVKQAPRYSLLVRITHWIAALSILALLVTGGEIVLSHPRFYWGETGNVNTPVS